MTYDKAGFLALVPKVDAAIAAFYGSGGPHSQDGREMLAEAWIAHDHHRTDCEKAPAVTFWPGVLLSRVGRDDPEAAWLLLTDLLSRELPRRALYPLGGQLQGLIASHSSFILAKLEEHVPSNPRLRHLLGGVWRDPEMEPYWARLAPLRGEPWDWGPDD